jgi:hypothetical protein
LEPVIHPYNPYSTVQDVGYGEYSEDRHKEDAVNSPLHYRYGKIEVIDYLMQVGSLYPGHQAVLVGNCLKYLSRAPLKGDKEKDLRKAQWYLNKLIETL